MAEFDYDLITIGAGSGGVRASRIAAAHGARVAIVENSRVGGTCVIRGCVPKKLLVYGSQFRDAFEDAAGFGWRSRLPMFDWGKLIAHKDREIDRLNGIYINLLKNSGVDLLEGQGRLEGPNAVRVDDRVVTAGKILIATGSRATRLDIPGAEHTITSDEALHLPELPNRIAIVGGGYIALEFASIFNTLDCHVHLFVRKEKLLTGFDDDLRVALAREMTARGVEIHARSEITDIKKTGNCLELQTTIGQICDVDQVMMATGRRPNIDDLNLDALGVATRRNGAIIVDESYQTSVPGIFAVGDVTDRINLTPVAIAEGHAFADTQFGGRPRTISYDNVPFAVFSQPTLAGVGMTEEQARAAYGHVDVYMSTFRPMKNTLSGREEKSVMKLIVDRDSDRVVGAHMVGPDAPEIIQGLAIALKCGATKAQFDATIGIHPTAAEEFVTMRTVVPDRSIESPDQDK